MFLSQYGQVRIINLPQRADRRRQMDRELARFYAAAEYFNAVRPAERGPFASIGFHGSYLSHLGVLAGARGESVLILEDDCLFTSEARGYRVAPATDIFYGGFQASDPNDLENSDMIGAHCMGFSARAAKLAHDYLAALYEGRIEPDPRAEAAPGYDPEILPPIDGAYVWFRRAHPELKVEFAQIARQRPSRSDCTPGRFDAIPALRSLVGLGRRARAALGRS